MQMAKAIEVRDNFKKFCDAAYSGDPVYISRSGNKNVVMIAADKYHKFLELERIAEIEAAVKRAEDDIKEGRTYTADEVRELMRARFDG